MPEFWKYLLFLQLIALSFSSWSFAIITPLNLNHTSRWMKWNYFQLEKDWTNIDWTAHCQHPAIHHLHPLNITTKYLLCCMLIWSTLITPKKSSFFSYHQTEETPKHECLINFTISKARSGLHTIKTTQAEDVKDVQLCKINLDQIQDCVMFGVCHSLLPFWNLWNL